jgi:formiminoglutamase
MFENLSNYRHANPALWQGRKDTTNAERFFEKIAFPKQETELISKDKKTIFLGFGSDAGVKRNQGRPGAKLGPDQIRTQLAKLPCSLNKTYFDLGTIVCEEDELELAQEQLAQLISFCHQQGHRTIVLGGGHEIAWGHYQGLAPHYHKLGIINFDAHFDIRPCKPGEPGTSGTPFSQIAAWCDDNRRRFDYSCLGIQTLGNTTTLFQRAQELKINYLTAEDIYEQNLAWSLAFLDKFMLNLDHIYLTICLDVFAECFAPGVSAPQPLGLTPWQVLPLLKYIMQSGKVVSLDIAELSPPLDQDQKTARLAALIIAELLHTI